MYVLRIGNVLASLITLTPARAPSMTQWTPTYSLKTALTAMFLVTISNMCHSIVKFQLVQILRLQTKVHNVVAPCYLLIPHLMLGEITLKNPHICPVAKVERS